MRDERVSAGRHEPACDQHVRMAYCVADEEITALVAYIRDLGK